MRLGCFMFSVKLSGLSSFNISETGSSLRGLLFSRFVAL
jgi:hypothetical protein